jgi:SpoIID/LytB domain protein
MKRWIAALIALAACWNSLAAQEKSWPDTVKVLLADGAENLYLEVKGKYKVIDPHDDKTLSSGSVGKAYPVIARSNGLRWGEEFLDRFQIGVIPQRPDTTVLLNGVEYRGKIYIYQVGNRLSAVNEIPVEEFCMSIMGTTCPAGLSDEAAAALAIVLRSDTYYRVLRAREAYWQVRADEAGYFGPGVERRVASYDRAVETTRGMILTSAEWHGSSIPAQWTENCAGKTASYSTMHRKFFGDVMPGVESSLAARAREESGWSCTVSKRQLAEIAGLKSVSGLSLYTDPFSNKVYAMRFFDGVDAADIDFFAVQEAIGRDRIQSSDFTVSASGTTVTFTGFGKGPGVGLCLYSANALTSRGKDAATVLKAFFPGAQLKLAPTVNEKEVVKAAALRR